MSKWYEKVAREPENDALVVAACEWFDAQLQDARAELDGAGQPIEQVARRLAGLVEFRYAQLQEIKAIVERLELRERVATTEARRRYLEHYNRQLSEVLAKNYAEIDPEVLMVKELLITARLIVGRYEALMRGFEYLHFEIGNITRLRVAGIEDSTL